MEQQTIVAQTTPVGQSGVACIRLSGPKAFYLARKISNLNEKTPHRSACFSPIYDEHMNKVDDGVFVFFKSPLSYTGEDVVEISCHGNPYISDRIIQATTALGARVAEPGEYTKRAFLNGKIDLAQAESVGLLISSRSREAAEHQTKNLSGAASNRIKKMQQELVALLSRLEFEFDISEEEANLSSLSFGLLRSIKNNYLETNKLIDTFALGHAYTSGLRVVIVGEPNVGKSTLMNSILGSNRSITDFAAGTTRDTITAEIIIGGIPATFVDTAGIRRTKDRVELAGVDRALSELDRSDLVLSVFSFDTQEVENIDDMLKISVYNKSDRKKYSGNKRSVISVSALKNKGIKNLIKTIEKTLKDARPYSEDILINTERQKSALQLCSSYLEKAIDNLDNSPPSLELVAADLRAAIDSLSSFLGKTTTDEILDNVFSTFCVGK